MNHISSAPTVHVTAVAVNKENLALWTREPVLMDARRGGQGDFVILVYQFTYSIEEQKYHLQVFNVLCNGMLFV